MNTIDIEKGEKRRDERMKERSDESSREEKEKEERKNKRVRVSERVKIERETAWVKRKRGEHNEWTGEIEE